MAWVATAVIGTTAVTGYLGAQAQADAASSAASAQTAASQAGIEEQRRQFDRIMELLSPYSQGGEAAFSQQQAMLGLLGPEAQQQALEGIQSDPTFNALTAQGEDAILQNASATGGLRGGNTQAALSQFRPNLLNQMINQKFNQLGGLTHVGQASAAGQAAAAQQQGVNIADLLGQQGSAQAGSYLAAGQGQANMYSGIGNTVGTLGGLKLMGKF
jgi:hypothetical protein